MGTPVVAALHLVTGRWMVKSGTRPKAVIMCPLRHESGPQSLDVTTVRSGQGDCK